MSPILLDLPIQYTTEDYYRKSIQKINEVVLSPKDSGMCLRGSFEIKSSREWICSWRHIKKLHKKVEK
jgi:hypothetical protein